MTELVPIEQNNQRVLLTNQLAEMYGTDEKTISYNYNYNKGRYIEGTDFVCLEGDAKRDFIDRLEIPDGSKNALKKAAKLYLWTEHGALLHAKSLGTDEAWKTYGKLVDTYFAVQSGAVHQIKNADPVAQLRASAMKQNATNRTAKFMLMQMEAAGIDPKHRLISLAEMYNKEGIAVSLPPMEVEEKTYDLTEMAEALGMLSKSGAPHAQAVGAIVDLIHPNDAECVRVPFQRNGHAADSLRYKELVFARVQSWLKQYGYPTVVHGRNGKDFKVTYREAHTA